MNQSKKSHIVALEHPFRGHFQTEGGVWFGGDSVKQKAVGLCLVLSSQYVKSICVNSAVNAH